MLVILPLLITALIVLRLILLVDDHGRDWTTNFAAWTDEASDASMQPLRLPNRPPELSQRIARWAGQQPAWKVLDFGASATVKTTESGHVDADAESTEKIMRLHLTRTTPLFRFVDDIHVTLEAVGTSEAPRTIVRAESKSRVGKGDLGQNPRNLRELRSALEST
ncbi:MAG: DUF1499 domain-containing protein [Planctomycetota bacterium]